MKLRFRRNSLRLRLNRREVDQISTGTALEEQVWFPGNTCMRYVLEPGPQEAADATFHDGTIRVLAPRLQLKRWAQSDDVGLYFDLPADGAALRVAIEKDLECLDGPESERDPDAFPRAAGATC